MPLSKEYWQARAILGMNRAEKVDIPYRRSRRQLYKEIYNLIGNKIDDLYFQFSYDKGLSTTRLYEFGRWRNMQADIQQKISHIKEWQNTEANRVLSKVYKDTLGSTVSEFGKQIQWGNAYETQMQYVLNQTIRGENFSQRIWNNTDILASRVERAIQDAAALGQGADNLKKQIRFEFGASFKDADRLIRTETMRMYNAATLDGYKDTGLVDEYEFLAEEDDVECEECSSLNGQQFRLDEASTGENFPPIHPNCRCCIIPVVQF